MTNAQAALQAAVASFSPEVGWPAQSIIDRAEWYKKWLDEQDEIDRKKNQAGEIRTYGEI